MTIQTLRRCRSEEGSNSVWQIVSTMGLKVKKWLNNSQFELREARHSDKRHRAAFKALWVIMCKDKRG